MGKNPRTEAGESSNKRARTKAGPADAKTEADSASPEPFVSIGTNRRVTVRKFKGKVLIDVREFYADKETGNLLPGKKGVALTPEQWAELKSHTGEIDAMIANASASTSAGEDTDA